MFLVREIQCGAWWGKKSAAVYPKVLCFGDRASSSNTPYMRGSEIKLSMSVMLLQ